MTIKNLWRTITGNANENLRNIVAQRYHQIFADHGVFPAQIPRLMPLIRLADLESDKSLFAALTPEILDQTAKFFGISLQWLEGASDKIYVYRKCYKNPEIFIELFCAVHSRKWIDDIGIPFRVLTTSKKLDGSSSNHQPLVPVLVEKIANLDDKSIYRYIIFNDGFDWGELPCRIQLKAMARMAYIRGHTATPLLNVKPEVLKRILEQEMVPYDFINSGLVSTPSLEDFALPEESPIAKEVAEFPYVLEYIEVHRLDNLFTQYSQDHSKPVTEPPQPPETAPKTAPKKMGKRADNEKALWEPVRAAARTLWAEHGDSLIIAEAIKQIQKMQHLQAASKSESAIRKHINKLAPENVRGKSGRKPNKST